MKARRRARDTTPVNLPPPATDNVFEIKNIANQALWN
jgi:hypothetical protein